MWWHWHYYKSVNATTSFRYVNSDVSQQVDSLRRNSVTTVNFPFAKVGWNRIL